MIEALREEILRARFRGLLPFRSVCLRIKSDHLDMLLLLIFLSPLARSLAMDITFYWHSYLLLFARSSAAAASLIRLAFE
jgi:hypothetical protein